MTVSFWELCKANKKHGQYSLPQDSVQPFFHTLRAKFTFSSEHICKNYITTFLPRILKFWTIWHFAHPLLTQHTADNLLKPCLFCGNGFSSFSSLNPLPWFHDKPSSHRPVLPGTESGSSQQTCWWMRLVASDVKNQICPSAEYKRTAMLLGGIKPPAVFAYHLFWTFYNFYPAPGSENRERKPHQGIYNVLLVKVCPLYATC
jgi:hypothetical protein